MYQSLLHTLKPLVYEGKTGTLHVAYKYDDHARLFLREGIVEQVETTKLHGKQAAATCIRWISTTTHFEEKQQDNYTSDPEIDTNSILSFLEGISTNIEIINKNIQDENVIYQIDAQKLNSAHKLNTDDLKIAFLLNGKHDIKQALSLSAKSELAVLTHICRLILAGVAKKKELKNALSKDDQTSFLQELNNKLIDLIGPAGPILMEDGFKKINSHPDVLTREDISPLLKAIGSFLDPDEETELRAWGSTTLKNYV
jgi:hypothetical protein